jgi:hypothetical protein
VVEIIDFFSWNIAGGKKTQKTSLNVGEQFLDEGFYEIYCFFRRGLEGCGKKDTTTSLNVGEQFSDEGFYEIYCFFRRGKNGW